MKKIRFNADAALAFLVVSAVTMVTCLTILSLAKYVGTYFKGLEYLAVLLGSTIVYGFVTAKKTDSDTEEDTFYFGS